MAAAATTARLRRAIAAATGGGGAQLRRALRGGTSLALLAALAAAACDTDTIDLLPMDAMANAAGAMTAGASATLPTRGGTTSAGGGGSGSGGSSGSAGAPGDDHESRGGASDGFGGRDPLGFGGSFGWPSPCLQDKRFCACSESDDCEPGWQCEHTDLGGVCLQPCGGREPCPPGYGCDASRHRCEPSCDRDHGCAFGRVCDAAQLVCVECVEDTDCDDEKEPEATFCDEHRCVECRDKWDCGGSLFPACLNGRCSECATKDDCGQDRDCDTTRGRCY